MRKLILLSISVLALVHAHSQAGDLDKSFAGKGWTPVDFIKGNLYNEYATQVLKTHNDYTVVFELNSYTFLGRFEPNGKSDDDFANGGFSDPVNITNAKAVVQKDGKIVIAGSTYNPTTNNYDFALARLNDNGTLDKSFSGDGKQTTDFFGNDDFAYAIAIQADGKIVVAGHAYNPTTNNSDFALARYNTNGSLDHSFDGDGKQTTDFFNDNEDAYAVVIQTDGRIVAAGQVYNSGTGNYDFGLARYNTNGSLDNSFDGDGKQTTDFLGLDDYGSSLALQANGNIVLAGQAYNPATNNSDFAIARYNTDGSLDNSFDGDGKVTTDFFGGYDVAAVTVIQSDGKILAAGHAFNPGTGNEDFALARYNPDGSLDNSFDGDGQQTTDFSGGYDIVTDMIIQPDGNILVAGYTDNPTVGNGDFALARYNPDGSLNSSLDGDGKFTGYYPAGYTVLTSVAVQSDGKVVVGGFAYNPATNNMDFALARFNTDGSLDKSFSGDGKQTTDFSGGYDDILTGIAIQSNGKIVVVGQAYNPATNNSDFAIARYNTDGSLDNSFDGDGKVTTDFLGSGDNANAVVIQGNGKIVVGGEAYNPATNNSDFAIARYNTDGSLDNSFDGDGKQTTDFFDNTDFINSIALQTNGRIVAGGIAVNPATSGSDFALARYNTDGSLDNSFDGDGKLSTDVYGPDDYLATVLVQTNGKIVAAGYANRPTTGNYDFALYRYNSNGSADNSFDGNGRQSADFDGGDDGAFTAALQSDGKILAAGTAERNSINSFDFALARFNTNGALDKSFSGNGKQTTDFFGDNEQVSALAIKGSRAYAAGGAQNPIQKGILAVYLLSSSSSSSVEPTEIRAATEEDLPASFSAKALPNPSTHYFTVSLQSRSTEPLAITITDAAGRLLEKKSNVAANGTLQFGHNYRPGVYYAEIVQGGERTVLKLVKQ